MPSPNRGASSHERRQDTSSGAEKPKTWSHPSSCVAVRILVVDDEPSILSSTAALLRDMDFEVFTCPEASSIRAAIERVNPDVLLQDVRMPGLDLAALVYSLREDPRWRDLSIVVFTAGMDVEEIAERIGIRTVLEKPFRPSDLLAAIRHAAAGTASA